MRGFGMLCLAAAVGLCGSPALGDPPPSTAKKVSMEEFKALADGKTVDVEIFDMEQPVTATLVWNWTDESITGKALINNENEVDVKTKLLIEGDKACSQGEGEEPTCHFIYVEGNRFYEVRDDGEVHAVSTIQN
jgi:hypothetical protein